MATDSTIRVDIATEFTGKKAFSQADAATAKLTKSVKSLAAVFGVAFSARAVVAYGKASVKAFAADDKAAKILSRTLNNLGLAFADPEVKNFISTLEKQYGVLDDKLRPAYQKLITTTGDYKKSQSLLRTALDLSAQSGEDVVSVSDDLGRAYVGNTRGLIKYNLGLTKAQLAAMSFEDILKRIAVISSGQAALAADTYAGKLDKLTVASENAKEVLGGALLDALIKLGGGDVDKATNKIDKLSTALADLIRLATGTSAMSLKDILEGVDYKFGFIPTDRPKAPRSASPAGTFKNQQAAEKARAAAIKQEKYLAKLAKEQAAAALATAKAKKLSLAIDKANIALGKGAGIFDIEGIQINAALISQAEQLGKTTNTAQLLAIANDVARLNVKKSMYELEQAIASGDIKAIEAATTRLNADIKILSALTGQNLKLQDMQSILNSFKPKELIDQENLNLALLKIQDMLRLLGLANTASLAKIPSSGSLGSGIPAGDFVAPVPKEIAAKASISAILEYAEAATERANAFADLLDQQNAADEAALQIYMAKLGMTKDTSGALQSFRTKESESNVTVTIVDKTSGLIEVVQDAVIQNNRYGNNLNFAGAIAI